MPDHANGLPTFTRSLLLIAAVASLVLISLAVAWRAFHTEDQARARLAGMLDLYRLAAELKYRAADVNRWQGAYLLDALRGDKRALDDDSTGIAASSCRPPPTLRHCFAACRGSI